MDQLSFGRTLMGDSLGFHIIFALLGVGIPLIISIFELISLKTKDERFFLIAKQWSFGMATLFVVGAISGSIIAAQLSVLLPKFTSFTTNIVGISFYMETFAFFF